MIIERLDGTQYDLINYGMKTMGINIHSPSPRTTKKTIGNRHGHIDMGTVYSGRLIEASFFMKSYDNIDFRLLRNELFTILRSEEAFYIIDKKEPAKRWKVKLDKSFDIKQMNKKGFLDVIFISESPFCESIGTTLDDFSFDSGLYGIGMGLIDDPDSKVYEHTTNIFSIYNPSDIEIDPRYLPLKITYTGESTNLEIKNTTTGDIWAYTGSTVLGDVIELTGIRSLKNGNTIFGSTNRKLITITQGWNDFELVNATGDFEIVFDFRFYYL